MKGRSIDTNLFSTSQTILDAFEMRNELTDRFLKSFYDLMLVIKELPYVEYCGHCFLLIHVKSVSQWSILGPFLIQHIHK